MNSVTVTIWLLFALLLIFLARIPADIAAKKGYSKVGFFIFGLFLFLIALIVALCLSDKNQQPQLIDGNNVSPADELKKYKELFDQGILTKEEFEKKKSDLLNL